MTKRESSFAVVLLAILSVVALAFFAFTLYFSPMATKEKRIVALEEEISKQAVKLKTIRDAQPRLKAMNAISLPADVDLAGREYEEEMSKLLRKSGLEQVTVLPKPPDTKTVPTYSTKKPIYTRLLFNVSAKGDLTSIVDWLEKFYKMPLLHQIRKMQVAQVQKNDSARERDRNDLDLTAEIEALVLDKAEARKTLTPEKAPELPPLLAQPERQYISVAGKNIFFGPAPKVEVQTTAPPKVFFDYTPYMKLDSITVGAGGPVATIFDSYHNHDYQIKSRALGGYRVEVSYYINGRKRTLRSTRDLEIRDEQGELEWAYTVIRIDDREVIVRDDDYKYYSIHIGQNLFDAKTLTKENLDELGIKMETPPPPAPSQEP